MICTQRLMLISSLLGMVACHGGAPTCKEALDKARSRVDMPLDVEQQAIGACEQKGWSAEARSCIASATSRDALAKCMPKMAAAPDDSYAKRAQQTEATLNLNKIGRNAKRAYADTGSFPTGTSALLPAAPTSAAGCCGGPDHKCAANPEAFKADPVWASLEFSVDEPSLYRYSYAGGSDGKSFTAYAIGDTDCDGSAATWTLQGNLAASGNPQTNVVPPPTGSY